MNNPITDLASLKVGTVQTVSTKEITAELEYDTPYTTALNTGNIINFPRINSYVLIPNGKGALVGIVTWLGIKKDNYSPSAHHTKSYDFINLPSAKRIIIITPLGILKHQTNKTENSDFKYTIERGISAFPSVGDDVNLPTKEQLKAIVESTIEEDRRVLIGTSPIASDAEVRVDPDKIFGRHLAVLGNTGSGKSCTVAGLIRWSLDAANKEFNDKVEAAFISLGTTEEEHKNKVKNNTISLDIAKEEFNDKVEATFLSLGTTKEELKNKVKNKTIDLDIAKEELKNKVNANFIILDVNGEYSKAFEQESKVLAAYVDSKPTNSKNNIKIEQLKVPMWLWNDEEWVSFSQASPGVQAPALLRALENISTKIKKENFINMIQTEISKLKIKNKEEDTYSQDVIDTIIQEIKSLNENEGFGFFTLESALVNLLNNREKYNKEELIKELTTTKNKLENGEENICSQKIIDIIINKTESLDDNKKFNLFSLTTALANALESRKIYSKEDLIERLMIERNQLKTKKGKPDTFNQTHIDTLINRIESLYKDEYFLNIINNSGTDNNWLYNYTQSNNEANITIIDLSLIGTNILHTIISVVARIIFEKHQEYKKKEKSLYQTILVLEEAHRFISKDYKKDDEFSINNACVSSFNKIAREGRKFGLGLVISSQRPHEISGTVLSQCNTFLLHRIVNYYDQDFVKKLVPDSLGMFMDELPALPSQQALLLGWASPIPKLVNIRDLKAEYRPDSEDPKIWNYWLGSKNKESAEN